FVVGVNVVLETAFSKLVLGGVEPEADDVRDASRRRALGARTRDHELDRARAPAGLRMLLADAPAGLDDDAEGAASDDLIAEIRIVEGLLRHVESFAVDSWNGLRLASPAAHYHDRKRDHGEDQRISHTCYHSKDAIEVKPSFPHASTVIRSRLPRLGAIPGPSLGRPLDSIPFAQ